jgi:hypothetical protein
VHLVRVAPSPHRPCDGSSCPFETFSLCMGDCHSLATRGREFAVELEPLACARAADPIVDGMIQYLVLDRQGLALTWSTMTLLAASIRCTQRPMATVSVPRRRENPHRPEPVSPPTGSRGYPSGSRRSRCDCVSLEPNRASASGPPRLHKRLNRARGPDLRGGRPVLPLGPISQQTLGRCPRWALATPALPCALGRLASSLRTLST